MFSPIHNMQKIAPQKTRVFHRCYRCCGYLRYRLVAVVILACTITTILASGASLCASPLPIVPAVFPQSSEANRAATDVGTQVGESLESMGRLPWYDAEQGQVEPVPVKPRLDDSSNRDSRWVPKPRKSKSANSATQQNSSPNNTKLPGFWSALGTLFGDYSEIIGWLLLAIVVALVVGLIVYTISKMERVSSGSASSGREDQETLDTDDKARLENLPVQVQRPTGDLLAEADRLRSLGRLDEAIIYLFGHRLVQLDRAHAIRLARGKTNRQYMNEVRRRADLHSVLASTVNMFEQSYFGGYAIAAEKFDAVRGLQSHFESALAVQREAA